MKAQRLGDVSEVTAGSDRFRLHFHRVLISLERAAQIALLTQSMSKLFPNRTILGMGLKMKRVALGCGRPLTPIAGGIRRLHGAEIVTRRS